MWLNLLNTIQWEEWLYSSLRIVLMVSSVWIALKIIKRALRKMEHTLINRGQEEGELPSESSKRAETLTRLVRQGVVITAWIVTLLVIFRELGIDIAPILASAGIMGLAVGFGAQNLVRDVISGFFIILEDQIRVGDVAIVNGTGGLVEKINFRTIVLRDLSGVVHVFPNGTITTLANMTREWSAYVFEVGVGYKENVDQIVALMRRIGGELKQDEKFGPLIIDDIEVFGVDKFAESALIIKGRIRTLPIMQWDVGREFLRRLKAAFDLDGIEIPFPHRSIVFNGEDKLKLDQLINQKPTP